MTASDRRVVVVVDELPTDSQRVIAERFDGPFDVRFAAGGRDALDVMVHDASVLLAGWGPVDRGLLEQAERLQVIQKLGVGVDKIDLEFAAQRNVMVLRAAGINADAVAEMTVLLILALLRRFVFAVDSVRRGEFAKEEVRRTSRQLAGLTVGLIGAGHVGRAVAARFQGFGVRLVYFDSVRLGPEVERELRLEYGALEEVVPASDVLSLHIPLTTETRHIISSSLLACARRGALLVNTARGGLVDEGALIEALQTGRLSGAALDVTAVEPLPLDSPLRSMEQVIITPHSAGAVANNFPRVVERAYDNVVRALAGEPVPPEDVVVGCKAQ